MNLVPMVVIVLCAVISGYAQAQYAQAQVKFYHSRQTQKTWSKLSAAFLHGLNGLAAQCRFSQRTSQKGRACRIGRYFAEPSQSDFRTTHGGAPCPAMDSH